MSSYHEVDMQSGDETTQPCPFDKSYNNYKKLWRANCGRCFLVTLFCLALAGYTFLGVGIGAASSSNNPYIKGYHKTKCTLNKAKVKSLGICHTECNDDPDECKPHERWIAVWRSTKSYTVIMNPWSSTPDFNQSADNLKSRNLNQEYDCMCQKDANLYPEISKETNCDIWGSCVLEIDAVDYYQETFEELESKGFALLFIGLVVFAISLIILFVYACCPRYYHCLYTDKNLI